MINPTPASSPMIMTGLMYFNNADNYVAAELLGAITRTEDVATRRGGFVIGRSPSGSRRQCSNESFLVNASCSDKTGSKKETNLAVCRKRCGQTSNHSMVPRRTEQPTLFL